MGSVGKKAVSVLRFLGRKSSRHTSLLFGGFVMEVLIFYHRLL